MTISNLMEMAESSQNGEKTLWEKKLLGMSNCSFSHSVFKRLEPQTCKNQGLFGKGLIRLQSINPCQHVQSAQTDLDQNVLLYVIGPF